MNNLHQHLLQAKLPSLEKIYLKGSIPISKAQNAISEYCDNIQYDDVICLIDDTVFGNCKAGAVITDNFIFCKSAFESARFFPIQNIENISINNGFLNSSLFINNSKVLEFTQPNGKSLQTLFQEFNNYLNVRSKDEGSINLSTSNASEAIQATFNKIDEIDTSSIALKEFKDLIIDIDKKYTGVISKIEEELKEQKQKIKYLEDNMKELSTNNEPSNQNNIGSYASRTSETQANNKSGNLDYYQQDEDDSNVGYEVFDFIDKDGLFKSIKTMKVANATLSFVGDFLGTPSPDEMIRRLLSSFIAYTVVTLREQHIERNKINGLKNDVATLELIIFSVALLKIELSDRGINENVINKVVASGLSELLGENNPQTNSATLRVTKIMPMSFLEKVDTTGLEKTLRMRLLITNKMRKLVSLEEVALIAQKENFEKSFGEETYEEIVANSNSKLEVMKNMLEFVNYISEEELGSLFSDQNVYNKLQYTMDELSRVLR